MQIPLQPTLTFDDAVTSQWDVVVVGAGPAGSMAARSTAKLGLRVLLVDRAQFPRRKVCGCCMNDAALGLLDPPEQELIESLGNRLHHYELASGGAIARVALSGGIAISRERLDSHLISAAIQNGAQFLDSTSVTFQSDNQACPLNLKNGKKTATVQGGIAILATGLASGEARRNYSSRSYVGAGVHLQNENADFETGTVCMACHRSGYVGIVQLEDGRLDLAAAFDAKFVQQAGGLAHAAHQIVSESGFSVPQGIRQGRWQGTVRLSHHRPKLYGSGYLVVGDAAGYVEPFTGEGIAWAMAGGRAVASFAQKALTESTLVTGPAWAKKYRQTLAPRMRTCRAVSFLLRQRSLLKIAVHALRLRPKLAHAIERSLSTPFPPMD